MTHARTSPILPAALAALTLALGASHARAQVREENAILVDTSGFETQAGQARVRHRIELAARRVCGLYDAGSQPLSDSYRDCHARAIADADAQLQTLIARRVGGGETLAAAAGAPRE